MIGPYFQELSTKYKNITFIKVDVDAADEIAASCGIEGIRLIILALNSTFSL
jgi:hypothetical protein